MKHSKFRKKPVKCTCQICGVQYIEIRYLTRATCSDACKNELIRRKRQGQDMSYKIVIHKTECMICGKAVERTGTEMQNRRTTCSDRCSSLLRSRLSSSRTLPSEMYEIISEKRSAHPNTGHFETNFKAKEWSFIAPNGMKFSFKNLALFIDEHCELFTKDELSRKNSNSAWALPMAYFGLSRLAPWRSDTRDSWHGWRWNFTNKGV